MHGEKIIDREILFSITSDESFSYVFQPSFRHHDLIKNCCLTLHIKNIRILQRIKRFIEDITPSIRGIEGKVAEDVLRSLTLYVWSYYDKASDAPPLEFILDYSPVSFYLDSKYKKEVSPEVNKWHEVMSSYGYFHTDDVDKCLIEFVETGYINKPKFSDELRKKNEQYRVQKREESYMEVWEIYRNSFDDDEQYFVEELVSNLRSNIKIISPSNLQSAVSALRELKQDALADDLVDEYFRQRNSEADIKAFRYLERSSFLDDFKDEKLLSHLHKMWTSKEHDKRSLAETLKEITSKEGTNWDDVRHLDSFTVDDYYKFFKAEKSPNLYHYVRKCLDLGEINHDTVYKSVGDKAKEALLKIASESRINRMRVSNLYKINVV